MPRLRCGYLDCIFLEAGYCVAEIVKIDPDEGCLTYTRIDDIPIDEEGWDQEDWDEDDLEEDLEEDWYSDEY